MTRLSVFAGAAADAVATGVAARGGEAAAAGVSVGGAVSALP
jgi:hypothetical protein